MCVEQKSNKVIKPASVYTLSADDTNQVTEELQNVITAGGLTPTNSTLTQVRDAINTLIDTAIDVAQGNPWQKPTDWVDIRSGALDESVYFLVGHSADYSSYPKWAISANVSNSGTYDIFADGIKVATSSSGETTTIDWQTLALTSGFDVTYPTALRTHIVRVAPSLNTNTITAIRHRPISGQTSQCALWAHFTTSNFLNVSAFTGNTSNTYNSPLLDAITSRNDELNITMGTYSSVSGITGFLKGASTIKKIPTLVGNLPDVKNYVYYALTCGSSYLKKLKLKQINTDYTILRGSYFEEIETDIPMIMATGVINDDALLQYRAIKKIPLSTFVGDTRKAFHMTQMENLEPTVLDFSSATEEIYINVSGTSAHAPRGIKGLTVSSDAPFDSTTSPQINVAYTGMDRGALVALFNSLPTVTAGQVCNVTGATGAADLTASDLAIANNKGWTVTR